MKFLFAILLLFLVASPCLCVRITSKLGPSFNVVNYGAIGNGQTDDSQAFLKAWQNVCNANQGTPTLTIPYGKIFMLQPVSFVGPCKSANVNIEFQGTITAPNIVAAWKWPTNDKSKWIEFSGINNLVISGGGKGKIVAQGAPWWNFNVYNRPTALFFHNCQNLKLSGLMHRNSARNHIGINTSNGARISHLHIIAPAKSPNTDGIDISSSSHVTIQNSIIETGDDCIAINSGSSFINITGVSCGPGHGISVGSLGNGAFDTVEEVHVKDCTFNGSTNGARIKTRLGGSGYARKITFENIQLVNAYNPVIIDQQYNPREDDDDSVTKVVKVSDVTYRNITGTSASGCAILLNCDSNIGCSNIVMEKIKITSSNGQKIYASCTKAQGVCTSCIPTVPCLS